MKKRISATDAARGFSDLINRVRYRGEEFVIERSGEPICAMVPVGPVGPTLSDLAQLIRTLPAPDEAYLAETEALTNNQPKVPSSPWES